MPKKYPPEFKRGVGTVARRGDLSVDDTVIDVGLAIVFWIEDTYNRRRRQRALGKLTPVECELAFTTHTDSLAA